MLVLKKCLLMQKRKQFYNLDLRKYTVGIINNTIGVCQNNVVIYGWGGDDDNDDGDDCIDGEPDCNVEFGKNFRLSSFRKSYNGRSLKSYGSIDVTCDTCSIAFTPSITFGLEVRFVKLRKVKLTVNGDLRTTVRVSASGSRGGHHEMKKIATFRAPPIIFSIGAFPVKLQVTVPVNAGYSCIL